MDFAQIKAMLEKEGMEASEKEVFDTMVKALESSDTKIIYDAEKEIFGRYTDFVRITAYFKQFHTRIFGILDVFLKGLEFSKKV